MLLETVRRQIRGRYEGKLDKDEWRTTRYGVLGSTIEDNNSINSIVSQDVRRKAFSSEGQTVSIPVFNKGAITLKSVRSCTIDPYDNDTDKVDLVWLTMVADIDMKPGQYLNQQDPSGFFETMNEAYSIDLGKKLKLVAEAFSQEIEETLFAYIDLNKSVVSNSTLVGGKYAEIGGVIQVPQADQTNFWNDLKVIMNQDDFWGPTYKVLGNTALQSPINFYINQGGGNAVNTNYQFADYMFRFSNHITNGGGVFAAGFCYPEGTIGMLTRMNADALQSNVASDGTKWYQDDLSFWGLPKEVPVGVQYKSNCADISAVVGNPALTASMQEFWQFSVDIAYLVPYNSDPLTKAGAIKKFEFLNI